MAFASAPSVLSNARASRLPRVSARRAAGVSNAPRMSAAPQPARQTADSSSSSSSSTTTTASTTSPFPWRSFAVSTTAAALATIITPIVHNSLHSSSSSQPSATPTLVQPVFAAAKFSKKTVSEKLSQVPVFAVTNASGQPYLAKMDGSGSQIGLIFFSHLDALNMLKDMKKNPGASDARVYIMGLDKAYEMVKAKPTPSGIRGSGGEEMTMVFRFYPDSKQVKAAEGLQRKMRLSSAVQGVPVFVAKGLTLRKGNENIVPLFLTKEDLDASWAKLRESNKDLPNSAPVAVGNLLYIIQQMETDEQPELRKLGFFAPRASVEYVSKEQAGPTGQARLHQNPVNAQQNK